MNDRAVCSVCGKDCGSAVPNAITTHLECQAERCKDAAAHAQAIANKGIANPNIIAEFQAEMRALGLRK